MSVPVERYITPAEYLEAERDAFEKSEYFNGRIYAMPGSSANHNRLASNAIFLLMEQLAARPCDVFSSDMRVKVEANGLYTYPDVSVVCDEPQIERIAGVETLLNPAVLIEILSEVLSESTAQYDRGTKWLLYRDLPTLRHYVLIGQDEYRVEHYARQPDGRWLFSEARGVEESIELESIGCRLPLDRLYARVKFEREQA
jgi:Uma2 family endonuclease